MIRRLESVDPAEAVAAAGLAGAGPRERLADAVRVYEGLTRLWHLARGTGAHGELSAN